MIDSLLRGRLEACATLPTLPTVAVQVLRLCQADNLDLDAIAKVITNDPALTAKILRAVNSPLYGLSQQIKTVSHAAALLGPNTVRALTLSFSLAGDLRKRPQTAVDLRSYWKRSLMAAVAAREAAPALGAAHLREEAFLAGLLQDIGRLALLAVAPGVYASLSGASVEDHLLLTAAEQDAVGCDHAAIGRWLTDRWGLPRSLCLAVGFSHAPATVPSDVEAETAQLIRIVALSGRLADIWLARDPFSATISAREFASRQMELRPPQLEPVLARVAANLGDVSSLFEIEVGTLEEIRIIFDRAREGLSSPAAP